jgi:hypothetical protein
LDGNTYSETAGAKEEITPGIKSCILGIRN